MKSHFESKKNWIFPDLSVIQIILSSTRIFKRKQTSGIFKVQAVSGNSWKSASIGYLSQSLQGDRSSHGLGVFLIGTGGLGLVVHAVHCDLERTKQRNMKQYSRNPPTPSYLLLTVLLLMWRASTISARLTQLFGEAKLYIWNKKGLSKINAHRK